MTWTPKRARSVSRRNIESAKSALLRIAYQWGDINEYVIGRCDEIAAELDVLNTDIDEAVEYYEETN